MFVANPPPVEELVALYRDERYFARARAASSRGHQTLGYRDYLADRPYIEEKFRRVLGRLRCHGARGEVLDVGAGPGFLLSAARGLGWSGRGVELNPWAAAHARETLRVDVRTGAFGSVLLPEKRFGVVTMMDFLEHVPSAAAAVEEAARVSGRGGMLAVLTPDAGAPLSRLLRGRWPEVMRAPGHLSLFSAQGLGHLLEARGYEIVGAHSVGKTSSAATLVSDVSPAAPRLARLARPIAERPVVARRALTVDPRTKVCMYARLAA
jgi:2-polyprenyl-3-methyl-5-hydroxy-6-metoxy-1,4-benzoquinol methylase